MHYDLGYFDACGFNKPLRHLDSHHGEEDVEDEADAGDRVDESAQTYNNFEGAIAEAKTTVGSARCACFVGRHSGIPTVSFQFPPVASGKSIAGFWSKKL